MPISKSFCGNLSYKWQQSTEHIVRLFAMKTYWGKPVSGGIAMGNIKVLQKNAPKVEKRYAQDPQEEKRRFERAKSQTQAKLRELHDKTAEHLGKTGAAIFEMLSMLLDDPEYLKYVHRLLEEQRATCEHAIFQSGEHFARLFGNMESAYMRERASDFRNLAALMIDALNGAWNDYRYALPQPSIVVAHDLSPTEAALLDKDKVLAVVTAQGSVHSHTAILARIMKIPALVDTHLDLEQIPDGTPAIVDGAQGVLIVEPDRETTGKYKALIPSPMTG